MKLEIILGTIVLAVFLVGGIFYATSTSTKTVPEDTRSAGTIHDVADEKQDSVVEKVAKNLPVANDISTPDGFINTWRQANQHIGI